MLRSSLSALVVLMSLAGPAAACLNDREIDSAEREFKSNYQEKAAPSPSPAQPSSDDRLLVWGGAGAGSVLLVGALVLGLTMPRRRDV